MALTKENLVQLIAIQEADTSLDKLKSDMDNIPVFIVPCAVGAVVREHQDSIAG